MYTAKSMANNVNKRLSTKHKKSTLVSHRLIQMIASSFKDLCYSISQVLSYLPFNHDFSRFCVRAGNISGMFYCSNIIICSIHITHLFY